ncbi:hypothetical protein Kfla_4104 [Kribbella flavida DSM 17836]|uniref:Chitin-binding type-3 domain-containing protein n=1 Tax=Kribbella flavida (strain DSM 17836 / JCM 10339 / NBRC 14399) TaxID=479435 RepID=D2PSL3_KRIFD|nr:hypothetical protein [Kribbella flavida]ADB33151.1 hypothetical protein Kfla_4104 [Kribbella flavida DSM 17836]
MKLPVRSVSMPNRAASVVLLLAAVSLSLTVGTTTPAEAREPSPPTNCSSGVDRRVKAWAECKSGYGTYRVWARCNWSASTLYGQWKAPSRLGESAVFCVTPTNQAGIVMAYGIQKRDG